MMLIVNLGKYGDITNVLPIAFKLSKQLGKVRWLVGKEWASILDGASYVEPVIFNGRDDDLGRALTEYRGHHKIVTQAWKNPDADRTTDSFAQEQWRYAGLLEERGKWPLIFDKRSPEREQKLIDAFIRNDTQNVLVGTTSVSTPYRYATRLIEELYEKLHWANVIPLDNVKAERLYDLIGLYDAADFLVTVDTCHQHLVRASYCPVIALVNDGWMGATPPPPQTIASWRYAELGHDMTPVVEAARKQLSRKVESLAVVFQTFKPDTDRHKRAFSTHPKDSIYSKHDYPPSMKEMLQEGLDADKDVVVFTNDDVSFPPGALEKIKAHALKFDFGCSRRPRDPVHCGREIFWFNSDWLRKNWDSVPNPYWSVQKPDLIMCRWMRHLKGIPTTLENLDYDFPPVDVPDIIYHEDHPSHWTTDDILQSKEGLWNEHLWEKGV